MSSWSSHTDRVSSCHPIWSYIVFLHALTWSGRNRMYPIFHGINGNDFILYSSCHSRGNISYVRQYIDEYGLNFPSLALSEYTNPISWSWKALSISSRQSGVIRSSWSTSTMMSPVAFSAACFFSDPTLSDGLASNIFTLRSLLSNLAQLFSNITRSRFWWYWLKIVFSSSFMYLGLWVGVIIDSFIFYIR